jgi:hypothetical protein
MYCYHLSSFSFFFLLGTEEREILSLNHHHRVDNVACSIVYILAILQYPRISPARSRFPASQFKGLSGSGADNNAKMA